MGKIAVHRWTLRTLCNWRMPTNLNMCVRIIPAGWHELTRLRTAPNRNYLASDTALLIPGYTLHILSCILFIWQVVHGALNRKLRVHFGRLGASGAFWINTHPFRPHFAFQSSCANKTPHLKVVGTSFDFIWSRCSQKDYLLRLLIVSAFLVEVLEYSIDIKNNYKI